MPAGEMEFGKAEKFLLEIFEKWPLQSRRERDKLEKNEREEKVSAGSLTESERRTNRKGELRKL